MGVSSEREAIAGLLALASRAARQAAEALRRQRARGRRVRRALQRDLKIEADYAMQRVICRGLRNDSAFPILSEEQGGRRFRLTEGYHWIVDPLDGSINFSRAIPLSCVSIALWRGARPILGVIHDVNRREQFRGAIGRGAWLNGHPITVSRVRVASEAVLCTGFHARRTYSTRALLRFIEAVQRYQKIRLLGSSALSLAYVACGRADAYREEQIPLWDVAAGLAIVEAAGGIISCSSPRADHTVDVAASNASLEQRG